MGHSYTIDMDNKCLQLFNKISRGKKKVRKEDLVLALSELSDEANLEFKGTKPEALANMMLQMTDDPMYPKDEHKRTLSYKEFRNAFQLYSAPNQSGIGRDSIIPLMEERPSIKHTECEMRISWLLFYQNNSVRLWWLFIYIVLNILTFGWKYYKYCNLEPTAFALSGRGLCVARGMAQVCLLNSALILLPVCRNVLQFLRISQTMREFLPLDDSILFHKICGYTFIVAALVHTIGQFYAYIINVMHAPTEIWNASSLARSGKFPGPQPTIMDLLKTVPGWTGVALVVCILIATPFTFKSVRHNNFNLFWYSHFLFYPIFMGLTVIHGIQGWMEPTQAYCFVTLPFIIYSIDRYNKYRLYASTAETDIIKVSVEKDSLSLRFVRPNNFGNYIPGSYILLNVPQLSTFEYHPFTLTSAPDDDFLSVNIRACGDWTNELHELIQRCEETGQFPKVKIDGPVGAPTELYQNYDVVLMIGAGIGVTPFVSILRDAAYRLRDSKCPNCGDINYKKARRQGSGVFSKLYFHWTTRTQSSLRWFAPLMEKVARLDPDGKIEIHNHLTSVAANSATVTLKMIQSWCQERTGHDIISNLKTKERTHFGRPDWDSIFGDLIHNHPNTDIGVFFCGAKSFEQKLSKICMNYSNNPFGTTFDFHSEKF